MFTIRLASDRDSQAAVEVVRAVYDEYGFGWFPETYHADLYALDRHYADRGDLFWIAESPEGAALATVSLEWLKPPIPGTDGITVVDDYPRIAGADCALNRLYVLPSARSMGLGRAMVQTVVDAARAGGCRRMELWSDKRFEAAHHLYERFGGVVLGDRICHDPEQSPEYGLRINL